MIKDEFDEWSEEKRKAKVLNIFDLNLTDLFYVNPIVAWAIIELKGTNGKNFLSSRPIIPDPFDSCMDHLNHDEKIIAVVPAVHSYMIKNCDGVPETECYFIQGCISEFSEQYHSIRDFYDKKTKEIKK